ncbi:MAG: hypothetical protein AB1Z65_03030 [Candidatus Sulfomarinibacteraceae bacterium]
MDRTLEEELSSVIDDDDDDSVDDMIDETAPSRRLDPDSILDSLVPQSIDWRDTVRRYPIGSVLAVGLVGYLVGRTKGSTIMSGLTAGLSAAMMRQLSDVFEGDFFDY